jgi:putative membrane protein
VYVRNNIRWRVVWKFSWRSVLVFTVHAILVCVVYGPLGIKAVSIPWQPVATLGIAVSFYIGFKNNGSYDRFWEGRQLWGGIVNYSRLWAVQALEFVTSRVDAPDVEGPSASADELTERHRHLVHRQIAWCNSVRLQLRRQIADYWDTDVAQFLSPEESEKLRYMQNPAAHIIRLQAAELRILREERGLLNDFQHMRLVQTLEELYNLQGGCERIKNTPFPRQYAYYSFVFVWLFSALLPLGLVSEFDKIGPNHVWLMVPFSVLVSWVFNTIEEVGHTSENPFENQMNDVPMTSICRTIEIDLREMLGEDDIPKKLEPIDDILY